MHRRRGRRLAPCALHLRTAGAVLAVGLTVAVAASPVTPVDAAAKRTKAKKTTTTRRAAATTVAPTGTGTDAPVTAAATAAFKPTVTWSPCGTGIECGQLTVPLDYANQSGATVQLGVVRRPARAPSQRIGILVMNPGGPAGSAFDQVSSQRAFEAIPGQIADRFDIVGIDPRGVNRSIPVLCAVNPPSVTERTERSKAYAGSCGQRSGNVLAHVGTDSSARDIESLRIAMGENQISYLGYSYGTYLGGLYAQFFPERVRSMVLDGGVDPTRFGVAQIEDRLRAQERTLNAFFAACRNVPEKDCQLRAGGKDPRVRYEELLLIASQTGIGREKLNRDMLEGLTGTLLEETWSGLAQALSELSQGGTSIAFAVFDYLDSDSSARFEDGSYEAIACRDGLFPSARPEENVTPAQRLDRFKAAAPHFLFFSDYWANDAMCLSWPVPARPRAPLSTTAGAAVMVVGNSLDFRTPIEWSRGIAQQLGASLVVYDDYGHTIAFDGDRCIDDAVTKMLVSATPSPGLIC